jgi:hypothetical protein
MDEPLPFLHPDLFTHRHNTAWRVEPGRRDPVAPVLAPRYPWDSGAVFAHGTALFDPIDRRFKLWNVSNPADSHARRLTYAESEDGLHWTRPELDLCPYDAAHPRTNVLLDLDSGGNCSYASVFVDPEAAPERRYEMFLFREAYAGRSVTIPGLPLPPGQTRHPNGTYRYRSPDGLRWTPVEGPVIVHGRDYGMYPYGTSDTCYVYKEPDGTYVSYHKTLLPSFPGGPVPYDTSHGVCRLAARRTSPDGSRFGEPLIVMAPDWRDPQDTQIMELLPLPVPGGYVAIVTVFHTLGQTIDLQFAASRDGISWWRPDRRPCLANDPLGDYCGGMIWPTRTLIEHEGSYLLYFCGLDGLHGDPFDTGPGEQIRAAGIGFRDWTLHGEVFTTKQNLSASYHGGIHRAVWTAGRLWAMVSAEGGDSEAACVAPVPPGAARRLVLDAATQGEGQIAAELLDGEGRPLPGFDRAGCVPFRGDDRRAALRWEGQDGPVDGASAVRFYMRRARLYGFAFT